MCPVNPMYLLLVFIVFSSITSLKTNKELFISQNVAKYSFNSVFYLKEKLKVDAVKSHKAIKQLKLLILSFYFQHWNECKHVFI